MSKYLTTIYLTMVIAFTLFIFFEIRYGGGQEQVAGQAESTEFKSMAQQLEETETEFQKAEAQMPQIKVDPEYETMVPVSEGEFVMGNNEGNSTEKPERKVYLERYWIDKYEQTFVQYFAFVNATGHRKPRLAGYLGVESKDLPRLMNPFSPVVGVSWEDAAAYCRWKGKRLPTEAEWEKAAKGTTQRKWPWGNQEKAEYANLKGEADNARYTAPAGAFRQDKSPYGAFDMAGNVMEWVADWYQEDYYTVMPTRNPVGPEKGVQTAHFDEQRVIRGASWNDSLERAQTTVRFKMNPNYRDVTIGFRCAKPT
jgi:formylglycine-generating enzyme required for sulfatase activity